LETLKERGHAEVLGVKWRITIRVELEKIGSEDVAVFICLRVGTSGGLL